MYTLYRFIVQRLDATKLERKEAMIAWPGEINKIGRRDFGVFQRRVAPFRRKLDIFDFKDSAFRISI